MAVSKNMLTSFFSVVNVESSEGSLKVFKSYSLKDSQVDVFHNEGMCFGETLACFPHFFIIDT